LFVIGKPFSSYCFNIISSSAEPFITPSFFQKYTDAIDEWTLSVAMANDTASGGLEQLETHYDTFIVSSILTG
jgi:hypothetical protein